MNSILSLTPNVFYILYVQYMYSTMSTYVKQSLLYFNIHVVFYSIFCRKLIGRPLQYSVPVIYHGEVAGQSAKNRKTEPITGHIKIENYRKTHSHTKKQFVYQFLP